MKRWLRPDMTEKLLTGTLSLNTTNQPTKSPAFYVNRQDHEDEVYQIVKNSPVSHFVGHLFN